MGERRGLVPIPVQSVLTAGVAWREAFFEWEEEDVDEDAEEGVGEDALRKCCLGGALRERISASRNRAVLFSLQSSKSLSR